LVFTGLPGIPKLGDEIFSQRLKVIPGAGFIPAVALTRLGMQVSWACDFGNDFFSRYVLEEADRQNLSTHLFRKHEQPLQAVAVAYSFAGDRAFLSYIDPLPATDLTALVRENPARCLLLMSLHTGADFLEAVETAHAQGSIVFMDGQVAGDKNLTNQDVLNTLQSVDILTLNAKEALQLTGDQNLESALDRLAALTSTVIIKLGADGAIAKSKGKRVHMAGIPTNVIDTTGAGDNFDCGFLYGLLHGYALEDCVRCGNFCGSRSATVHGGWEASPNANDLEAYLKQARA
jgi:sugar/nucleoside kinase (ribokinase family)